MKPKQPQPAGLCCYCALSKSCCYSTSECPPVSLDFCLVHLATTISVVIYSPVFLFHFLHLFISRKSTFSLSCGLAASQGVQICAETFLWWDLHASVFWYEAVVVFFSLSWFALWIPWSFGLSNNSVETGKCKASKLCGDQWFAESTVHIFRPNEALQVHLSPAVNSRSSPTTLTVPS